MRPGGQRIKGAAFERKIANILKHVWPKAKRGIQYRDGGKEVSDVVGTPYHIECSKGGESIWSKWKQAREDTQHHQKPIAPTPLVIKQRDREEPVVMLSLEEWLELVTAKFGCPEKPCWHDAYEKEFGKL